MVRTIILAIGISTAALHAQITAGAVDVRRLGGVPLGAADVVDVPNTAFRVNCVTGCAPAGVTTVQGNKSNNGGAPGATNLGVLPGVATGADPVYSEGNQVAASLNLAGYMRTLALQGGSPWSFIGTLTHNGAAPASNNLGVLAALATAADPTLTEGRQVLGSVDLAGYMRTLAKQSGVWSVGLTAGSALVGRFTIQQGGNDASVSAGGALSTDPIDRAARYIGRAFLRNPGDTANMGDAATPVRIDPTGTTTQPVSQIGAPWSFTGTKSNNGGAPGATNLGTLPGVATAADPGYTEGNQVAASLNLAGYMRTLALQGGSPWSFIGTLTHNGAAPAANNLGVLPALANAADPALTEGRQVLGSVDLAGYMRSLAKGAKSNNAAAPGADNFGVFPAVATASAPSYTEGRIVAVSTDLAGSMRIICIAGCGGAAPFTDNTAFTAGATSIGNIGAVFNDGLAAVTSGNAAAPRITAQRGLHMALRKVDGTALPAADNSANSTEKLPALPSVANTTPPSYTAGNQVPLNSDLAGNLRVTSVMRISSVNSSTATLAGAAVFTGTSEQCRDGQSVVVNVIAIGASAPPGTLEIQQSSDGTNWDYTDRHGILGTTASPRNAQTLNTPVKGSHCRVVYTNGATAQTSFRLQTLIAADTKQPSTDPQTYFAAVQGSASAATKDYLSIFNATGSNRILRVTRIILASGNTAVIAGIVASMEIHKTSTVGTTCTAVTIRSADSANLAVPATVTANHTCTTDPVEHFYPLLLFAQRRRNRFFASGVLLQL